AGAGPAVSQLSTLSLLDALPIFICDSAYVGGFIHKYRRDHVVLCQVEHSHHRNDPDSNAFGELTREQFGCLSHLDAFDLVTTLTEQQRRDMDELQLAADKLETVPKLT